MAQKEIIQNNSKYNISYEIANNNQKECIIFLHGWGSNKEIMLNSFAKYLDNFKLIFIDLPGFGNSSMATALNTKEYAQIINLFLNALHVEKKIIFGHSFGGKVALLLNPDILVLLSSAGILNKKSFKTRFKIRFFKTLKPFFGEGIYKFFATKDVNGLDKTMYETLKNVVDEDFSEYFKKFKKKSLIYWGKNDRAVPLSNAYKIASFIKNSKLRIYDGDHFFFLNNAKQICNDFKEDI